jgi:hypothetical protein
MITAPTRPIAYGIEPLGRVGTKVPKKTDPASGPTMKKLRKKQTAITAINKAKKP